MHVRRAVYIEQVRRVWGADRMSNKSWHNENVRKYMWRAYRDKVRGYDKRALANLERAKRHLQESKDE